MKTLEQIWKWIDHNRWTIIGPMLAVVIWVSAWGCTPTTESPVTPGKYVSAPELDQEFAVWQKQNEVTITRFELAGKDLERQAADMAKIQQLIIDLASGGIADLPGLVTLLITGGGAGAVLDNIRKRGLISGLKHNG